MSTTQEFSNYKLDDEPGAYGLAVLAEVGDQGGYEYSFTRAWVDAEGAVYIRHTSGCSCGSPFDEMHSLSDLIPVDVGTLPWLSALKSGDEARPYDVGDADWTMFVQTLRTHVLDSSNKRFDVEEYTGRKAKEAEEEAERMRVRLRRERTRKSMLVIADRIGLERPSEWWPSTYNDELYDFVHEAEQFELLEIYLLGATLHAMAAEQLTRRAQAVKVTADGVAQFLPAE